MVFVIWGGSSVTGEIDKGDISPQALLFIKYAVGIQLSFIYYFII